MGLFSKFKHLLPEQTRREYAIRLRLLRSSFSLEARRAERSADVLLISYPKVGRTWLTMLLSRAMASHAGVTEVDYLANDLLGGRVGDLPHIRISHDDNPHWKTVRQLARSKQRYRHRKVVLLVRDPRDTVVSMYFERTKRERAYAGTLHEFLHEPRGSLDTILAYYNVWARERARLEHFCLVRYEDLKADAAGQVRRILRFAGADDVSDAHIAEAVQFGSFENMRAMESTDALESGRLRARDKQDKESFKTRKGKVGGYVEYMTPAEIEWMEGKIRSTLEPCYGYCESLAMRATPRAPAPDLSPRFGEAH
ncbi:MAG: sulfotransferase domain-containing protein [Planctomycetes bacterium]|nr:sulfotransferase domain-containing protein [Planctomycetota bacterium]